MVNDSDDGFQDASAADLLRIPRDQWPKPKPKLTAEDVERLVALQEPQPRLGIYLPPDPMEYQFMREACAERAAREFMEYLEPGSIMDLTIQTLMDSENRVQPWLRVKTALATMSLALGRKVQTECGLLANLYLIGVAPTGEGKENGAKFLRSIDSATGHNCCNNRGQIEDLPFSDSSLTAMLRVDPVRLILADEFGQLMGANGKAQSPNYARLAWMMTKLYTHGRGAFAAPFYADQKKQKESGGGVPTTPFLSVVALTQKRPFVEALTSSDMENGFLPRNLVFLGLETPEATSGIRVQVIPQSLIDQVQALRDWKSDDPFDNAFADFYVTFRFTRDASDLLDQFEEYWRTIKREGYANADTSSLVYTRSLEQVKRVALLVAANNLCSIPSEGASIGLQDVQAALGVVGQCATDLRRLADHHISDTPTESLTKKILAFIRQKGPGGEPGRTLTEICKRFQSVPALTRTQILKDLVESRHEIVALPYQPRVGRAGVRYKPS